MKPHHGISDTKLVCRYAEPAGIGGTASGANFCIGEGSGNLKGLLAAPVVRPAKASGNNTRDKVKVVLTS